MAETLDSRVARLESDVANISTNVADIRVDLRQMRGEIAGLRNKTDEKLTALRIEMQTGFKGVDDEFKKVREEMQTGFKGVDGEFKGVDGEFKKVREDIAGLRHAMTKGDLGTRIWMLATQAAVVATILGVMAKGFGWIR